MNQTLTSVALVLAGGLLGLGSSFLLERVRRRYAILSKLFDEYIRVRDEVVEVLTRLAILVPGPATTDEALDEARRQISRLFYQYYDFLPQKVLMDLGCLDSCLAGRGRRFYYWDPATRRLRHLNTKNAAEVARFARRLSLFSNVNYFAVIVLCGKDTNRKRAAIVNYQARWTLRTLNEEFTLARILAWGKRLHKDPAIATVSRAPADGRAFARGRATDRLFDK